MEETDYKICKDCGIEKKISEYRKAGGGKWLQPYCKPCDSERKKEWAKKNSDRIKIATKKRREDNKDIISAKAKQYYEKNKEAILQYHKDYDAKNKYVISEKSKEYRRENNEYVKQRDKAARLRSIDSRRKREAEYRKNKTPEQKQKDAQYKKDWEKRNRNILKDRYKERKRKNRRDWCNNKSATDIEFRILKNLRSRTRWALKSQGTTKLDKAEQLLGCPVEYFKKYFSNLFTDEMTWGAFMNGEIHIDHIKPCVEFDLTKESEQRECFHYTNLQPLWQLDNLKKGKRYLHKVA